MNLKIQYKYSVVPKNRPLWHSIKQHVFVMKLILALTLLGTVVVQAKGYSQKIKIHMKNAPMTKVLEQVKKQSGLDVFYNINLVDAVGRVDVHLEEDNVNDALRKLLEEKSLDYSIEGRMIVVFPKRETPIVQLTLRGKVVNEEGEALQGVSIFEKDTNNGTTTDVDGDFELKSTGPNAVLTIKILGYVEQEYPPYELHV